MKIEYTTNLEKKDIENIVVQATSNLTLIIDNADIMTLEQMKQAIKKLAIYEKTIIKRLVQIV